MAILQTTDTLEEQIGNKYSLVIVAAKRARQLKEGHPALSQDPSPNPLSIALREVAEGKVQSIAPPEEDLAPAPREVISSLVADADFDLDEELDLDEGDAVDDLAALLVGADEDEEEVEADTEEDTLAATDDTDEAEVEEDAEDDSEEDAEVSLDEVEEDEDEEDEE